MNNNEVIGYGFKILIKSDIKFKKICESFWRIIEFYFHPYGEDHALILEGELTYDISFKEQIVVNKNSLVFGWTNYVYGYHNLNDMPLHILVFATTENIFQYTTKVNFQYKQIQVLEKLKSQMNWDNWLHKE